MYIPVNLFVSDALEYFLGLSRGLSHALDALAALLTQTLSLGAIGLRYYRSWLGLNRRRRMHHAPFRFSVSAHKYLQGELSLTTNVLPQLYLSFNL